MKIEKLLHVEADTHNIRRGGPAWKVTFRVEDGRSFEIGQLMQLNEPELHHVQAAADSHPDYFWKFWAKPVVEL